MATITSANSVFMLSVSGLFLVPQKLQGFSADDIFDVEAVETAETLMGVDGTLSAGFVFNPVKQTISLQADSASNTMFEAWRAAEIALKEKKFAGGIVHFPSVSRSYVLSNGVLSSYSAMSDAKKVLQPRKYVITWESVMGAPV